MNLFRKNNITLAKKWGQNPICYYMKPIIKTILSDLWSYWRKSWTNQKREPKWTTVQIFQIWVLPSSQTNPKPFPNFNPFPTTVTTNLRPVVFHVTKSVQTPNQVVSRSSSTLKYQELKEIGILTSNYVWGDRGRRKNRNGNRNWRRKLRRWRGNYRIGMPILILIFLYDLFTCFPHTKSHTILYVYHSFLQKAIINLYIFKMQ